MDRDLEQYLEDIKEIKRILTEREGYPLVEAWAFFLWGLLVFLGTFLSWWVGRLGWSEHQCFLGVWLPLVVVGAVGETVSWVRQSRRFGMLLFSPRMVRLMLAAFGVVVVCGALIYALLDTGRDVPGLYVMVGSIPLLFYGLMSYPELFVPAMGLLFVGAFLWIGGWSSSWVYLASGVMVGLFYVASGVAFRFWERRFEQDALHPV
ncbi:hypothetical protein [Spirochaeta thermophila]|nr:hypothetical protein [Spirochaeta thermophila]